MKLSQGQYDRLRTLFFDVVDLEPGDRASALDQSCADDQELRDAVERLLARSDDPTNVLREIAASHPPQEVASGVPNIGPHDGCPVQIGGYRIVRRLGEGGMGTVYEAEQDRPRRTVALKVIKQGASTPNLIRRFEHESQVLGRLQHSCIAQIYEVGTADLGGGPQPYFAMELVRGLPLIEFTKTNNLSIPQRLALFVKIGTAVHHAHQKGIIHRDLKPENILVTAEAMPKVLDFGVARVTDADVQVATRETEVGQIIGTISYMSPEQAAGTSDEIDIRSDVHSLGVILFELLTGHLPYEVEGKMLHEAVRALREDAPIRPSSFDASFRGDLDAIVSKALEKERERRYQSAFDFMADVERYLDNQPITARPPSAAYQFRKYAQRHKGVFAASITACVLLILGVIGTSFGLWKAKLREREAVLAKNVSEAAQRDAESARDEADVVTTYLASMLASADPNNLGRDVLVRDVLDEASHSIEEQFGKNPLVAARLQEVIGVSYFALGSYALAEPLHSAAAAIRARELGTQHPLTLTSRNNLAKTLVAMGKFKAAGDMHRRNYEMTRRILGEEHAQTLRSLNNLAVALVQQGKHVEAETLHREALEIRRRLLGEDHLLTMDSIENLAVALVRLGRHAEAEKLFRKALGIRRRVLGEEHTKTLSTMNYLGGVLDELGRSAEAEELIDTSLQISRRVLGEDHFHTLDSLNDWATVQYRKGRYARAEKLYRQALETQQHVLGEEHPSTLNTLNNLTNAVQSQGRYAEAEKMYRSTLEIRRRTLGEEHSDTLLSMHNLAVTHIQLGQYTEAEKLERRAVDGRSRTLGEEHPLTLNSMHNLASTLRYQGRYTEAHTLFQQSLQARRRILGDDHPQTLQSIINLADTLALQNKITEAETLYASAVEGTRRVMGKQHPDHGIAILGLAEVLLKKGETNRARELIDDTLAIFVALDLEDHPYVINTRSAMGECLTDLGLFVEAEPMVINSYQNIKAAEGEGGHETGKALQRVVKLYQAWGKPGEAAKYQAMLPADSYWRRGDEAVRP